MNAPEGAAAALKAQNFAHLPADGPGVPVSGMKRKRPGPRLGSSKVLICSYLQIASNPIPDLDIKTPVT